MREWEFFYWKKTMRKEGRERRKKVGSKKKPVGKGELEAWKVVKMTEKLFMISEEWKGLEGKGGGGWREKNRGKGK